MSIRPLTCGAIALALTIGIMRSDADDPPEPMINSASGVEFAEPAADQLLIRRVAPNTPAAAAGLCAGDVVLGIDRYHFVTAAEAEAYLDAHGPCPVRFTILRDGAEHKLVYVSGDLDPGVYGIFQARYGQEAGIGIRIAGSEPVLIIAVYGGSPADKAGILPGDALLAVNDVAYSSAPAVRSAMAQLPEGEQVRLTIRRNGADQTIAVTPEERAIALDEPVHVLPGWEGRYDRHVCHVDRNDFATRHALAVELESLRDEIRRLRHELATTNARRAARPADLTEE